MDYVAIALAFGSFLGLILHAFGAKHPTVEKAAEAVDKVEAEAKSLTGK